MKLSSAETKYSAFDQELLAAFFAMNHFRFLLEGRSFTLFTDHKPLTFALFSVSPPWSARQQRHLFYLSKFTSDLVHLPGPQNVVADALFRPASAASTFTVDVVQVPGLNPFQEFLPGSAPSFLVPPFPVSPVQPLSSASPVDLSMLSSLQLSCPEITALLSNPSLWVVSMPYGDSSVFHGLSTSSPRPLVPVSLCCQVFDALHNLSHPGVRPTQRLVSRAFVWSGLSVSQ